MDQALYLTLTLSSQQPFRADIAPILFMRTPRHQEPEVLVEVHTARKWKSEIANRDIFDTKVLEQPLHCTTQYAKT